MAQTLRQQARSQVHEGAAARKRVWAEREAKLGDAAVEVVAAIVARDRAEHTAARAIAGMLELGVTLTEIGERCVLPVKEVTRLKKLLGREAGKPHKDAPAQVNGETHTETSERVRELVQP